MFEEEIKFGEDKGVLLMSSSSSEKISSSDEINN